VHQGDKILLVLSVDGILTSFDHVAVVKNFTLNDLKRINYNLTFADDQIDLPNKLKNNLLNTIKFALIQNSSLREWKGKSSKNTGRNDGINDTKYQARDMLLFQSLLQEVSVISLFDMAHFHCALDNQEAYNRMKPKFYAFRDFVPPITAGYNHVIPEDRKKFITHYESVLGQLKSVTKRVE